MRERYMGQLVGERRREAEKERERDREREKEERKNVPKLYTYNEYENFVFYSKHFHIVSSNMK